MGQKGQTCTATLVVFVFVFSSEGCPNDLWLTPCSEDLRVTIAGNQPPSVPPRARDGSRRVAEKRVWEVRMAATRNARWQYLKSQLQTLYNCPCRSKSTMRGRCFEFP